MKNCIWYVSGFHRPWEASMVGNLATALKTAGFPVQVYVAGGTKDIRVEGVLSWKSLTMFERLAVVLFRGDLWHLWGNPPFWWRFIRLRARTVHTLLEESPAWQGHPTRLFPEQTLEGESLVKPTFETKVALTGDSPESLSALLLALPPTEPLQKAVEALAWETAPVKKTGSAPVSGGAIFVDDAPSNALLAAWATMQGIPVVARKSSLLGGLLGREGYLAAGEDSQDAWVEVLKAARSEEGRGASVSARRFLKEKFSSANAAESLIELYSSVSRKREND
ncbi:MAG: hypothetical protein LBR61_03890 [Synergistaceae bacterium]|jgi:hypothetical protein|nr:hypothetical protein [Synergistaceae bacterium]